ncbi:MAG: right-handed parallel beta-helix repeat-containing protein [Gemmatimonadales bacterium]|nr:right-handed parallel beta-helix repeat-containing protein [Gemmatimonadales bacterium]
MSPLLLVVLHAVLAVAGAPDAAPCVRPTRAGTQVQGEVRICPGRYRIADPSERGVIIAASSGTRIDLTGVVLESGDSVPARYVGVGVVGVNVDGVSILGGAVRGYRFGVRLQGGRGHRITGADLSGSRAQALRSTLEAPDSSDRLDPARSDVFLGYGGGILLQRTIGASVTGVIARGAQNGIALADARESYLADNDVSGNSGWGIHLWRSSQNVLTRNQADHTLRCLASTDCGAAAILLREGSDSNTIAGNDLTASSMGLLITGRAPLTRASVGNLVYRNDASRALGSGFVGAYGWSITFLENRADSVVHGFRLDHLNGSTLRGNTAIGARGAAILAEHGRDNTIESNVLVDARVGIMIAAPRRSRAPSGGYRIDDNVIGGAEQGIVLRQTTGSRVRGNLFDGVGDGLLVDGTGHGTEVTGNVFLRASGWFIEAPDLVAGGNFWATADAAAASARVKGRVSVLPWRPATAAGY